LPARHAGKDVRVMSVPTASVWERRAWAAGIVFVLALLAETAISASIPINQDDSAVKIAGALDDHRNIVLVAAYLSVVYVVAFLIYIAKLHDLLCSVTELTFALDSVGDIFGSVFLIAAGLLVSRSRVLPRWLARIAVVGGIMFLLQGFGLGGVIGTYGLAIDLIGFVLFLLFVALSSAILLGDRGPVHSLGAPSA